MFIKCILGSFLLATMSFWVTSQYTISNPIQGYLKVSFWVFVSRVVLESIRFGLGFEGFLIPLLMILYIIFRKEPEQFSYFRVPGSLPLMHSPCLIDKEKYDVFKKESEQLFSYFRAPGTLLMHSPCLIEKEKYDEWIENLANQEWLRLERQRNLMDVQAVLDSVKEDVTDGVYLELCNRFKDLFELN
tara:strand:- start:1115 stop:1678 length:564 start_codon:yes stop_codon:yes gene_type:complete